MAVRFLTHKDKKELENSARQAVNVKTHGAVGNGKHDDTDAIRAARDVAYLEKKPLYFPAGKYMVHGSIELWSDCEIFGEGSRSVIKKFPAITEVIKAKDDTGTFYPNQNTFAVSAGSKYTVGYDCYVGTYGVNYDTGLYGKIEKIEGNTLTVKPYHKKFVGENGLDSSSAERMNKSGHKAIISTSFPVFCTYKYRSGGITYLQDVYIHDLTIDGNRQGGQDSVDANFTNNGEADAYHLSLIHFDSTGFVEYPTGVSSKDVTEKVSENPHTNIRLENLNLYNSPADGISVQGSKNVCITNCITQNCAFNGVHVGVGSANISVIGCKLNANFAGYYDCSGVSSATISNNHFERCKYGVGGLDPQTRGATINGNTFRGCEVGVHAGGVPYPQYMRDADGHTYLSSPRVGITVCNNTFYGVNLTGVGISLVISKYTTVCGNTFRDLEKAIETGVTHSARISDNIIKDCKTVLSMIHSATNPDFTAWGYDTHNSAFVGNVIHAEISDASAALSIANAHNMLVTGNIITGTGAAINVDADPLTTTGVILENNIVAE